MITQVCHIVIQTEFGLTTLIDAGKCCISEHTLHSFATIAKVLTEWLLAGATVPDGCRASLSLILLPSFDAFTEAGLANLFSAVGAVLGLYCQVGTIRARKLI